MDKLSEHAIRMLEIADKPYRNEYGMINKDLQDKHDIARAVYSIVLQVQMLKMTDRKTEPNSSEKPNTCDAAKKLQDYYGIPKAGTKWIERIIDKKRRWYCPHCGDWQTYGKPSFCMNCGADLREASDVNQDQ